MSERAKFTAGPWWYDGTIIVAGKSSTDEDSGYVGTPGSPSNGIGDRAEEEANGYLMAAAPDFYAACQGHIYPDLTRLDWLSCLLNAFAERTKEFVELGGEVVDADAEITMTIQCERLLADLAAALSKARGEVEEP